MNLLWTMARNIHAIDIETRDKLTDTIIQELKINAGILSITKNSRHVFHFLPNLIWSLESLGVDD